MACLSGWPESTMFFHRSILNGSSSGGISLDHYRVWYRDILADYVAGISWMSKTLSRSYIEKRRVESVVRGHLKEGC